MKKVVLTLALAVTGVTYSQTHKDLGIEVDTTYEYGSYYYPVIVKEEEDADPYTWVYVDKYGKDYGGLMIYGSQEDVNPYCDSILNELGGNPKWKSDETGGYRSIKYWDVITEEGSHYFVTLMNYNGIGKLYIDELSYEEHMNQMKALKSHYIHLYGKEKYKEWLAEK